jgi:hypothetical protein
MQEGKDPEGNVDHRQEVPEAVERDGQRIRTQSSAKTATTGLNQHF